MQTFTRFTKTSRTPQIVRSTVSKRGSCRGRNNNTSKLQKYRCFSLWQMLNRTYQISFLSTSKTTPCLWQGSSTNKQWRWRRVTKEIWPLNGTVGSVRDNSLTAEAHGNVSKEKCIGLHCSHWKGVPWKWTQKYNTRKVPVSLITTLWEPGTD